MVSYTAGCEATAWRCALPLVQVVLLVDSLTGSTDRTAHGRPVLPRNTGRPETLYEQFREFVYGYRWVVPQW